MTPEQKRAYRQKNLERIREYDRQRYPARRHIQLALLKRRYAENKQEILSKHKAYYDLHRQQIAAKNKEWYQRNRERILKKLKEDRSQNVVAEREYHKLYYQQNRERLIARQRESYRKFREKRLQAMKEFRSKHPEIVKARKAKWYQEHRTAILDRVHRYRESNLDRIRSCDRRRNKENPEKHRIHRAHRRATELNAQGSHSSSQWRQKVAYYGSKCYYCGVSLPFECMVRDHAIPLKRGGTNFVSNLLPACKKCNSRKHAKTVFEFIRELSRERCA